MEITDIKYFDEFGLIAELNERRFNRFKSVLKRKKAELISRGLRGEALKTELAIYRLKALNFYKQEQDRQDNKDIIKEKMEEIRRDRERQKNQEGNKFLKTPIEIQNTDFDNPIETPDRER